MKNYKLEKNIYEHLGVKVFKKATFKLEKIIHHKDKKTNQNYHINEQSINGVKRFDKYLFYNGSIHVRALILQIIILITLLIAFNGFTPFAIAPVLMLTKDLYCIMLQRYNYIRGKEIKERAKEKSLKKEELIEKEMAKEDVKEIANNKEMVDFYTRMRDAIVNGSVISIGQKEKEYIGELNKLQAKGFVRKREDK